MWVSQSRPAQLAQTAGSVLGRASRYPWTVSTPRLRRVSSSAAVSTPSAVTAGVQLQRHQDDRGDERPPCGVVVDVGQQRPVQLDHVRPQPQHVGEGRVARAGVVHRQLQPPLPVRQEHRMDVLVPATAACSVISTATRRRASPAPVQQLVTRRGRATIAGDALTDRLTPRGEHRYRQQGPAPAREQLQRDPHPTGRAPRRTTVRRPVVREPGQGLDRDPAPVVEVDDRLHGDLQAVGRRQQPLGAVGDADQPLAPRARGAARCSSCTANASGPSSSTRRADQQAADAPAPPPTGSAAADR